MVGNSFLSTAGGRAFASTGAPALLTRRGLSAAAASVLVASLAAAAIGTLMLVARFGRG